MLPAQSAISRVRRDLVVGGLLKALLAGIFITSLAVPQLLPQVDRTLVWVGLIVAWIGLAYTSAKGSRLAAGSSALIATGQYEEAERRIDEALRSFSLFRAAKLQSLHHLAVLRHAQRLWPESAALSRALLRQRLGPLRNLTKPSRLLLADAMLEMNDLAGARDAITALYSERLSLDEVLRLLLLQLDYESRVSAWPQMADSVMSKVQLAELMPASSAARTQALLGLAAHHVGRQDISDWLRRRAALLVEPSILTSERPVLAALWP